MSRFARWAALGCVLAVSACSTPPRRPAVLVAPNPFLALERSGETVRFCVTSIDQGLEIEDDDPRLVDFAALLHTSLRDAGFETVEAERVEEVWKEALSGVEPPYDAITGRADRELVRRARLAALAALDTELGCQFRLDPSLVVVSIWWNEANAVWDGQQASLGWRGYNRYGTTAGLSLHLHVADLRDETVYFGTGGIQLAIRLGGESAWKDEFVPVDPDHLLADPELNQESIDLALEAMRWEE